MDIREADAATNGKFAPRSKLGDPRKQKINPWKAKIGH
jgi:hypothetical protein